MSVRAQPGARQSGVRGEQDSALKVSVTQVAEKGKANKALVQVLSRELEVKKSQLELISGETSQQKRFLVRDLSSEELARRIASALERVR